MIRDCKLLIELYHIYMVQVLEKYANRPARISKYKMINFDDITNENNTEIDPKWPYIPDHPYRILIKEDYWSVKTNALLNLINNKSDIDKIHLYAKDTYEAKYLIIKPEKVGFKDVYKNIEEYNLRKKCKVLIVFDDMIADIINNKKLNPVGSELFIRSRKLNIFLVFFDDVDWWSDQRWKAPI